MKKILIFIPVLFFASCNLLCLEFGTPDCIEEKIEIFKNEQNETCEDGAKVVKYKFQDMKVYLFQPGHCYADAGIEVFDENCELLCTLGTIVGITECNGEEFSNAEELSVVWEQ